MTVPLPRQRRGRPLAFAATLIGFVLLVAAPGAIPAATKEIEATARYHLGDNDSKLVGHRLAMLEAKRTALEKAGTYVESMTEVKDYQLTRDEIRTYSAGILRVEETRDPQWDMVGRNLEVTVFVKVTVDQDDVSRKIAALRQDKEATRELKEARAQAQANERKVTELNRQLKTAKKGAASTEKAKAAREEALTGIDSSSIMAHAAVAKRYSVTYYGKAADYVERQMPAVKGCYHSAFSSKGHAAAAADTGLAVLLVPALALMVCRPRKTGSNRTRREHS